MIRAYKKEINTYIKKIQLNKYSSLIFAMLNCFFNIRKKNTFFMSILLTFNKTDFLIASFDGVLGLSVEPSALGVGLEAFFSGEKVLGCSVEPSLVGVVEAS